MNTQTLLTDLTPQEEENVSGGVIPFVLWAMAGVILSVGYQAGKRGWF